jgi:hypothetical protein
MMDHSPSAARHWTLQLLVRQTEATTASVQRTKALVSLQTAEMPEHTNSKLLKSLLYLLSPCLEARCKFCSRQYSNTCAACELTRLLLRLCPHLHLETTKEQISALIPWINTFLAAPLIAHITKLHIMRNSPCSFYLHPSEHGTSLRGLACRWGFPVTSALPWVAVTQWSQYPAPAMQWNKTHCHEGFKSSTSVLGTTDFIQQTIQLSFDDGLPASL